MSDNSQADFKTREVHAGVSPDPVTGAILTPIYQTTTYVQESGDQYLAKGYWSSKKLSLIILHLGDYKGSASDYSSA